MARKRKFEPMNQSTPATNQPIHSAPTPTVNHPSHSAPAPADGPAPTDESQLAINNAANKSRKKSMKYWTVNVRDSRGGVKEVRLRSSDVFSLPPGKKILMEWSEEVLPVGEAAGLLGHYLGAVGANFKDFPISYERWPDVPGDYKTQVYNNTIKSKFDVNDDDHKHYILGKLGKTWKDNRKLAYDRCYDSSLTWEQSLDRRPQGIDREQWAAFLTYRLKPENLEKAAKNAANRAKQTIPHTLGTMTLARFKHILEVEDGRRYSRGDMFSITHKSNDGSFINDEARKKSEELETHRQENSSLNDDAYTAVFGKEHSGRVRGVGFGVVPSQYFGSSSGARAPSSSSGGNGEIIAMRQELDESKARVRDLEEKFAMLAQQFSLYTRGNEVPNMDFPMEGRPSSSTNHEPRP